MKLEDGWQQKLQGSTKQKQKDVTQQIKLHGKPYLPGSSLKGAIRTALIGEVLLRGGGATFEEKLEDSLGKSVLKPFFTNEAERAVWGSDPHHDPLRGLRLGDSNEVSPQEYLAISDVRVLGFDRKPTLKLFWEKLGRNGRHLSIPGDAGVTRIFLETLQPGTTLEGELSLNTFLLEEPGVKDQLGFQSKSDLLMPEELSKVCQRKYEALFRQELELYERLNAVSEGGQLTQLIANLIIVREQNATLRSNEFLLQCSWGTGWRAKTVGEQIQRKLLGQIDEMLKPLPGKDYALADFRAMTSTTEGDFLSPKTRRLVMEGNTPAWPLGWVKVSLHEA